MALHNFICDECNIIVQDANTKCIHKCPNCGKDLRWDLNIAIHGNYNHPIHSDSLAINPNQVEEHKRLFPNIRLDGENRPIFDNFVAHENYLKKTGFIKRPQKIKPKREGKRNVKKRIYQDSNV